MKNLLLSDSKMIEKNANSIIQTQVLGVNDKETFTQSEVKQMLEEYRKLKN